MRKVQRKVYYEENKEKIKDRTRRNSRNSHTEKISMQTRTALFILLNSGFKIRELRLDHSKLRIVQGLSGMRLSKEVEFRIPGLDIQKLSELRWKRSGLKNIFKLIQEKRRKRSASYLSIFPLM